MSYTDLQVHNLGDSGAYGLIDESHYLKKIESTPMPEDPMAIENHLRGLLVDFRPDAPFLASDQVRDPSDKGGGTHSQEILNIRHFASRSSEDPYLPDGTFLDWQFAERDPRGVATGPDMRKHYEQQMDRAAFIRLYNDNDFSVPESGINPVKMVENINSGFYQYKDRYKNFDESFDGWHNGGIHQQGKPWNQTRTIGNVTVDGTIKDLVDAAQGNRRDAVAKLSGDPTIGFRYTVPDQRFKVASYGMVRANQDKDYQNWNNNRSSSFVDHSVMRLVDEELVNKSLANLIIDLEGLRKNKQVVAQGAAFSDSSVNQVKKRHLNPEDIYKLMRTVSTSGAKTANEAFDGKRVMKYGNKPMNNNRKLVENVQMNHKVLSSMEQATSKSMSKDKYDDLRKDIKQSAANSNLYHEVRNKKLGALGLTESQLRNSGFAHSDTESLAVKSYKGIKPTADRMSNAGQTVYDEFGAYSLGTQSAVRRFHESQNKTDISQNLADDTDIGKFEFGVQEKANLIDPRKSVVGSTGTSYYHETETNAYGSEVNDVVDGGSMWSLTDSM